MIGLMVPDFLTRAYAYLTFGNNDNDPSTGLKPIPED
jgi:hypothetical protein